MTPYQKFLFSEIKLSSVKKVFLFSGKIGGFSYFQIFQNFFFRTYIFLDRIKPRAQSNQQKESEKFSEFWQNSQISKNFYRFSKYELIKFGFGSLSNRVLAIDCHTILYPNTLSAHLQGLNEQFIHTSLISKKRNNTNIKLGYIQSLSNLQII